VDKLKRHLRREVLGDLRTILGASGIRFLDIGGVMSDDELQVPAYGLIEGHEQPLPSVELDMKDNLAQPVAFSPILLVKGIFRMEVERGLVYPHQTMLDDVWIDTSPYAVVKMDMVHNNSKDLKLEVPLDDTTVTMRDAVTRWVQ
jgi:hypothetical protein